MGLVNGIINWTRITFEPLGATGLFFLAFIESIFFPIPPDFLLIVLSLGNPEMALFFALMASIGSLLGGMVGYKVGHYGGLPILKKFVKQKKIDIVHKYFEKYEVWAIGIAGFTPIPYKVFTISAGVFFIDFKKFVIVSAISRSARFFIVATLLMFYGVVIQEFIDKYFNILTMVGLGIVLVVYIIYKKYKK